MALRQRQLPALLLAVSAVAMGPADAMRGGADWQESMPGATAAMHRAAVRGGRATSLPKLMPAWRGNALDLVAAAAVGGAMGCIAGSTAKSAADVAQLLYTHLTFTLLLRKLGLIHIEWHRVHALLSCATHLPLRLLRLCRAERRRRREEAARSRHSQRVAGDEDCDASWWLLNEHAAVGGVGAFAVGAWLVPATGGAGQDEEIAIAAEIGRICGRISGGRSKAMCCVAPPAFPVAPGIAARRWRV
eukprot:CAMPEP_0202740896 /NCGR_PEP_ID=MMETSP1388-20130828/3906_1 /ASSEMBLY_ACC=CAM_ASM_000864 /TAXON_ID=37098 /ORGANISM="Isochrysis sp, Strain CCMP1244" /LENGTH=245 /DNA_ID=CAMNT_0049407689 /DNA_START=23 /DNA_END=762 /DNA_ORIENTATION=-